MCFISLLMGKLYKKPEKIKLKNFPAGYVGRFYRNLADNVNNFLSSDFSGRIAKENCFTWQKNGSRRTKTPTQF